MADFWGRTLTFGGVIPGERIFIEIPEQELGMIGNAVRVSMRRQSTARPDILSARYYVFSGLPAPAEIAISGIVADPETYKYFITQYADICANRPDLTLRVAQLFCGAPTTLPGTTPAGTTPEDTTPEGTTPEGTTPAGTTPAGTTGIPTVVMTLRSPWIASLQHTVQLSELGILFSPEILLQSYVVEIT